MRFLRWLLLMGLVACGREPERAGVDGYRPASERAFRARGWRTDVTRSTVPLDSIRMGPELRGAFVPFEAEHEAAREVELDPSEPVLVLRGKERLHGWPLVHLLRRELALDLVDGIPVAVTYCSLCSSARVFDRRLGGEILDLRVSGLLLGVGSLLHDAESESLFAQSTGEGILGLHAGERLVPLPSFVVSFGALREAHPEASVLRAPPAGGVPPLELLTAEHLVEGTPPEWLTTSCPAPFELHVRAPGRHVFLKDAQTAPVHRTRSGELGPSIGSRAAFDPSVDGRSLSIVDGLDRETGSRWNALGEAIEGPLAGRYLEPVDQVTIFRYVLDPLETEGTPP